MKNFYNKIIIYFFYVKILKNIIFTNFFVLLQNLFTKFYNQRQLLIKNTYLFCENLCYYLSVGKILKGEKMDTYKIVLLDESLTERTNLKETFIKDKQFEVVGESSDGQKGVELVLRTQPDLIVMDLVLETLDGIEVISKIRESNTKAKILVLSSLKNDGFIQKSVESGADYYMLKPAISDILIKRAKELLDSNQIQIGAVAQKSQKTKAIEEKLSNIFITIGIPAHIKGYQFLREAIKMAMKEPNIINSITGQLYPSIANTFSTSPSKVERAIRHAIEVAWNRGKIENINNIFGIKIYSANEKPTNGEFIALVADKMLYEGA